MLALDLHTNRTIVGITNGSKTADEEQGLIVMTNRSKTFLVIAIALIVFGTGYFISRTTDQGKSLSEETTNSSSSDRSGTMLDLSGQQLTALPESVLNRTDVTVLNISNNQLTTLPAGIAGLVNLTELNAENNRLESVPPELAQLKSLIKLRLDNNRITNLPAELFGMTWLEELDISNNRLPSSQVDQLKSKLSNTEVKV